MQVTTDQIEPTKIKLTIKADQAFLDTTKQVALQHVGRNVKVQGFREGKAPANLIEKNVDPAALQSEFLDHAVNDLYVQAVQQEQLRPVGQPQISLTKFVPYSTLEFTAEVEAVGEIKLPDYKKIKLAMKSTKVTPDDVNDVVENLRARAADKQEVTRAAKDGDEVTIDFAGTDAQTGEPITGADGKDYPLALGSKTFIPGFEDKLLGIKPGEAKEFDLVFPKDYGVDALKSKKVKFKVNAKKVSELVKPPADDAFAAKVGPFKSLAELKADIRKQLEAERKNEALQAFDNELLQKIAAKSQVDIPPALVEEEIDRTEEEEKRNLVYRGQTWQEHLDEEGVTAEEHREKKREASELRVKAGLVLGEISNKEKMTVSPEDLEVRIMLMKNQYTDEKMQAELDKPENRRDVLNRMLTEKTLEKLRDYATSK